MTRGNHLRNRFNFLLNRTQRIQQMGRVGPRPRDGAHGLRNSLCPVFSLASTIGDDSRLARGKSDQVTHIFDGAGATEYFFELRSVLFLVGIKNTLNDLRVSHPGSS